MNCSLTVLAATSHSTKTGPHPDQMRRQLACKFLLHQLKLTHVAMQPTKRLSKQRFFQSVLVLEQHIDIHLNSKLGKYYFKT